MFYWKILFLLVLLAVVGLGKLEDDLPEPTCKDPLPPPNGYVSVNNRTVGSTINVGCKPGYYRTGTPPFTRTCQDDGEWSNVEIKCRAQSCGDPGRPRNGRRLGLQFNYLHIVRFTCNYGYVLHGPSSRRCQDNQTWSLTQPLCKPVSCGEPPKVKNAVSNVYGHSRAFVYGNKVLYTCRPGFQRNRRNANGFISCGGDGQWHGTTPYCAEILCPKLASPDNGRLVARSNYTKEAERVRYQCHAGYMMFGPRTRTCLNSGQWSGPDPICFKCSEVGTQVFVRKPHYFKPGKVLSKSGHTVTVHYYDDQEEDVVIIGPGTQHYIIVEDRVPSRSEIFVGSRVLAFNPRLGNYMFASVVYFKGKRFGVRYDGNRYEKSVVELQKIRTLEPPRFCATCQVPGQSLHSSREDDLTEFIPGMEVIYTCEYTFKMIGSERRTCLNNGTWTGKDVSCIAHSCDDLDALPSRNGERFGNNFTVGSTLEFKCREGYSLIGQKYLKCLSTGKWSHVPPTCRSVCANYPCPSPGEKCISDKVTVRRCVCRKNIDCPAMYSPVCGSDGVSYNSHCIMAATACRTGRDIKMVRSGPCQPGGLCHIVPYSMCRASFHRFFYNSTTKKCQSIIAGGCHASGWNGFVTESQCNEKCKVDICQQPANTGPCINTNKRWHFDSSSGKCKRFLYGGCFGNENNFASEELCLQKCQQADKGAGLRCQECPNIELRKACKQSSIAMLAKVVSRLPNVGNQRLLRYVIDVQYIIKNTNLTIQNGRIVLSIPYKLFPDSPSKVCACPRLPLKKKFILIGQLTKDLVQSKNGFILNKNAFVAGWGLGIRKQIKLKCASHVMIPNNIR